MSILFLIFFLSCDENTPVYYYDIDNFDLLRLGSNITDLIITSDGNTLIASDEGNNRVIFIDIRGEMTVTDKLVVGSKPNALALTPADDTLYVSLEGSSQIAVVDMDTHEVSHISLQEDGPMDVELSGNHLLTTFVSDQSVFHRTKLYNRFTGELYSEKPKAGLITRSTDDANAFFVLDHSFERVNLYRYDISGNILTGNIQSSDIMQSPVILHDIQYIPGAGVAVALGGLDFEGEEVRHAFVYEPDGLNLMAHLDSKSEPIALAVKSDGSSVFISPSRADNAGTFIIEFDTETWLQRNYYLTAGKLAERALIIDPVDQYIYCAVDDMADNSTDEPYFGNSFDIQRIPIVPFGTFPINDF